MTRIERTVIQVLRWEDYFNSINWDKITPQPILDLSKIKKDKK